MFSTLPLHVAKTEHKLKSPPVDPAKEARHLQSAVFVSFRGSALLSADGQHPLL